MSLAGCSASFSLGANSVAELTNISNAFTGDSLDTTNFDSSCMRSFIAGLRGGTIDISGFYDPTDTNGQVAMFTAFLAGNVLGDDSDKPIFLVDATHGFTANGIITSYSVDASVDGLVGFSASIQLTSTITVVSGA